MGGLTSTLKSLVTKKFIEFGSISFIVDNDLKYANSENHTLNDEQKIVHDEIIKVLDDSNAGKTIKPILLKGVTGSGKTEIFLQAMEHVLKNNGQVLYLIPEINLSSQILEHIKGRFPDKQIEMMHSQVAKGRRVKVWKKIRDGFVDIVIGTRSALFAPMEKLGLIIVDEEHDSAYKQDFSPRYNARDSSVMRANIEKCVIILGSATPSLESYKNALDKKYQLMTLNSRVDNRILPIVHIINILREPAIKSGGMKVICFRLIESMKRCIAAGEQVILFINRRGFASYLRCQECGEAVNCIKCSAPLRYHKSCNKLICHLCDFTLSVLKKCGQCSANDVRLIGYGTEKVVELISKFFPKQKILRLDADVTASLKKEIILDFRLNKSQILVGTQMLAKGFHFPNVSLVGVLNADQGLNMPDFRCNENTFQLLTQVAGRAGRGHTKGEVVIQSAVPHSSIIQYSRRHAYDDFAEDELDMRKQFNYPPFIRVSLVKCHSDNPEHVEDMLENFVAKMKQYLPSSAVVGQVVPSPIERIENKYRYQIMIRCPSNSSVVNAFNKTKSMTNLLGKFKNTRIFLDVDCLSFV